MAVTLNITGFNGSLIPNAYHRQKAQSDALCVIFGGWTYTTDMPVFYYTRRILFGLGFDVLTVELEHSSDRRYARLSDQKRQEWFLKEVEAAFDAASAKRRYRRTVVAAMSLGTMALAHLMIARKLGERSSLVWLSPLLEAESLRETLASCSIPSLLVVGKRSGQFDQGFLQKLSKNEHLDLMLIERANDQLEVEGDALRSIELLAGYVSRLKSFLGAAPPKRETTGSERSSSKGAKPEGAGEGSASAKGASRSSGSAHRAKGGK